MDRESRGSRKSKKRSTAQAFAAKLASVSAKKKVSEQQAEHLNIREPAEDQNVSMQFNTENQYDTRDNMLRQEVVADVPTGD